MKTERKTENCGAFLNGILRAVEAEIESHKQKRSVSDLEKRIADVPAVISFGDAIKGDFGLVAEIKERSPSGGAMLRKNVDRAVKAYEENPLVKAVSILTNLSHFGMKIERLWRARKQIDKPLLRKDFIIDEYQVLEARAFGADAILLMANILPKPRIRELALLAHDLGMEVLFESHNEKEIAKIPADLAKIWGVNSRKLDSSNPTFSYGISKALKKLGLFKDFSIDGEQFALSSNLPSNAIKVAESGMSPRNIRLVRDKHKYNAALVGNSLLLHPNGIDDMLRKFSEALVFQDERSHSELRCYPNQAGVLV